MTKQAAHWNLARFVEAQAPTYAQVLDELRQGRKTSHWMWFIFPQLRGLGSSAMARRYALSGLEEARAYIAHDLLGARLHECTRVATDSARSAATLFGFPDDLKFQSCMTLFEAAAPGEADFALALEALCKGARDADTLSSLSA